MVKTRGQARKADELPKPVLRKTEAIPGEEDSTLARWPPCAPSSRSRRGPRGGRNQGEAVDWAGLPDACLLCVFECLAGDKAAHAVSVCCQSSRPFFAAAVLLLSLCPPSLPQQHTVVLTGHLSVGIADAQRCRCLHHLEGGVPGGGAGGYSPVTARAVSSCAALLRSPCLSEQSNNQACA